MCIFRNLYLLLFFLQVFSTVNAQVVRRSVEVYNDNGLKVTVETADWTGNSNGNLKVIITNSNAQHLMLGKTKFLTDVLFSDGSRKSIDIELPTTMLAPGSEFTRTRNFGVGEGLSFAGFEIRNLELGEMQISAGDPPSDTYRLREAQEVVAFADPALSVYAEFHADPNLLRQREQRVYCDFRIKNTSNKDQIVPSFKVTWYINGVMVPGDTLEPPGTLKKGKEVMLTQRPDILFNYTPEFFVRLTPR